MMKVNQSVFSKELVVKVTTAKAAIIRARLVVVFVADLIQIEQGSLY